MSRTVIDGPKRCPRSEGLTNQLPIKHHPLEEYSSISGGRLESEETVSSSLWLEEVSGGQLQSEEAISSSFWLFIDTWVEAGGLRWMPTGLGPRSGTCFKFEYKWLRFCGCRADADVDVDGAGVI